MKNISVSNIIIKSETDQLPTTYEKNGLMKIET